MAKKKASKKKATKKKATKATHEPDDAIARKIAATATKADSADAKAAKKEADAEAAGGLMSKEVACAYIDSVIGVALMMSDLARKSLRNLYASKNADRISEIGKAYKAINIALAPLARKVPR